MGYDAFLQCFWGECNNVLADVPVRDGDLRRALEDLDIGWWAASWDNGPLYTFCPDHGRYHSGRGHRCFDDTCSGYWENGELYKKARAVILSEGYA